MNDRCLKLTILACGLICLSGNLGALAQSDPSIQSSLPVLPMNVRFRVVPQYFVQLIPDDPKYSRIEALIDDDPNQPSYEIILADKTTGNRIIYSNSDETVNTLQRVGRAAFRSTIQFAVSKQSDSISIYQIGLRDISGQEITWKFVVNPKTSSVRPGFMFRPNTSGFVLMGLDQRATAMPGTKLIIGNARYPATSSQDSTIVQEESAASGTFYGTDLTVAEIMPGTELWRVDSWPDVLKANEKWILRSSGGEKRVLNIESVRDDQIVIDQVDQDSSLSVRVNARKVHGDLFLNSLSILRQSHSFQIGFKPELPFPAPGLDDEAKVKFVVSEDGQMDLAHGTVLARRRFSDENLDWRFDAPDWARAHTLETGANVLIESGISRAKTGK